MVIIQSYVWSEKKNMIKLKYETLKFVRIKITSLFILVYSYEDYRKNLHKKEHFQYVYH